jgi:XapX domain-containing protein
MIEIIKALGSGLIVGFLFAAIKLPIPAPPALAGIMGIVGIYLGFLLYSTFFHK